jgi:hypothetical protein
LVAISQNSSETSFQKPTHETIARFETARRERNAPHPAPVVDQVMAEERATAFAKRSIKTSAKLAGLKLAVSMMDLTKILKIVDKLRAGVVWANTYNNSIRPVRSAATKKAASVARAASTV